MTTDWKRRRVKSIHLLLKINPHTRNRQANRGLQKVRSHDSAKIVRTPATLKMIEDAGYRREIEALLTLNWTICAFTLLLSPKKLKWLQQN